MTDEVEGHFSDGRSAARHEVTARLFGNALELRRRDDGSRLAVWPGAELRLTAPLRRGAALRLTATSQPEARLTLPEAALPALRRIAPRMTAPPEAARRRWVMLAGVVAAMGLLVGFYVGLPLAARPLAQFVPPAWEARLGEGVVPSLIEGLGGPCRDAAGMAALGGLTERIATANGLDGPFHLHVVRSRGVNALAAPGGHIILLDGLVEEAGGPEEVAGVLAHEMAHIAHRHLVQRLIRDIGVGVVATILVGDPSGLLAGVGSMLAGLSYGRDDEADADATGIAYLETAGLDSTGLAAFFRRLEAREKGGGLALPEILRSHPPSGGRAMPGKAGAPAMTQDEWRAVTRMCRR